MACSTECFKEYMNRIEKSRKPVISGNIGTKNQENFEVPKIKSKKRKYTDSETVSEN